MNNEKLFNSLKNEGRIVYLEITARIVKGSIKQDFGAIQNRAFFVRADSLPQGWYYVVTFAASRNGWTCSCSAREGITCKHLILVDALMVARFKHKCASLPFSEQKALITMLEEGMLAERKRKSEEAKVRKEVAKRHSAPLYREFSLMKPAKAS